MPVYTDKVLIRVTAEQLKWLQDHARLNNRTVSNFVRLCLFEAGAPLSEDDHVGQAGEKENSVP